MALKDKYLTVSQAAKELGVTRQTISRWIAKGHVPGERIGRETVIKKKDIGKYHLLRISETAADNILTLVYAKINEYFHEKGLLNEDERFEEMQGREEVTVLARKPDGTPRTIKISREQCDEAFNYCREPLAEFLYYFDEAVKKEYPTLINQKPVRKGRKISQ